MNQCPRCGGNVNPGAKFCPNCAYDLTQAAQASVLPETQVMQSSACPNCGASVSPTAKFCPVCAAPLGAAAAPDMVAGQPYYGGQDYPPGGGYPPQGYAPAASRSSKMPIIIGAIVLLALIGGGIAAYFLFFNKDKASSDAKGESPSDVVNAYYRTMEKGNLADAMKMLSKRKMSTAPKELKDQELVKKMGEQMAKSVKDKGGITELTTSNEKINGDTATLDIKAKVGQGEAKSGTVKLVKEDGKWKIDETPTGLISEGGGPAAGGGSPSDVTKKLINAVAAGDRATVNSLMSRSIKTEDVDELMKDTSDEMQRAGGVTGINITNENVQGDRASVPFEIKYGNGKSDTGTLQLVKEDGSWKVARF